MSISRPFYFLKKENEGSLFQTSFLAVIEKWSFCFELTNHEIGLIIFCFMATKRKSYSNTSHFNNLFLTVCTLCIKFAVHNCTDNIFVIFLLLLFLCLFIAYFDYYSANLVEWNFILGYKMSYDHSVFS